MSEKPSKTESMIEGPTRTIVQLPTKTEKKEPYEFSQNEYQWVENNGQNESLSQLNDQNVRYDFSNQWSNQLSGFEAPHDGHLQFFENSLLNNFPENYNYEPLQNTYLSEFSYPQAILF